MKTLFLPQKTFIGNGELLNLPTIVKSLGNGIIIHGQSFWKKKEYKLLQNKMPVKKSFYQYQGGEPTLQDVRDAIKFCKSKKACWIAGIGGGAVLDLAKATAGLYYAGQDPEYYQSGGIIDTKGIPFVAIPTTAGSGSEATINSVLTNETNEYKMAIRNPSFVASIVILDPTQLVGVGAKQVAFSGMDAITQAIESYFSRNASWYTETMALKGFEMLTKNIMEMYESEEKESKKVTPCYEQMLLGSYYAGMAFSNSGLGVVHGIAHPLGSYYWAPHGQVCAICLLPALALNKEFVKEKYAKLSEIVGKDLIAFIEELEAKMLIENPFKDQELVRKQEIISYTLSSGSTKCNCKEITKTDIDFILEKVFN